MFKQFFYRSGKNNRVPVIADHNAVDSILNYLWNTAPLHGYNRRARGHGLVVDPPQRLLPLGWTDKNIRCQVVTVDFIGRDKSDKYNPVVCRPAQLAKVAQIVAVRMAVI